MTNPIDWGSSPITVGLIRGIIASLIIGIVGAVTARQGGATDDGSIMVGIITAAPTLLALLGYGAYDQNRANNNIIIPGDVPESAEGITVKVK